MVLGPPGTAAHRASGAQAACPEGAWRTVTGQNKQGAPAGRPLALPVSYHLTGTGLASRTAARGACVDSLCLQHTWKPSSATYLKLAAPGLVSAY